MIEALFHTLSARMGFAPRPSAAPVAVRPVADPVSDDGADGDCFPVDLVQAARPTGERALFEAAAERLRRGGMAITAEGVADVERAIGEAIWEQASHALPCACDRGAVSPGKGALITGGRK